MIEKEDVEACGEMMKIWGMEQTSLFKHFYPMAKSWPWIFFWGCDEQVRQRSVGYDPRVGFSVGMQSDHP